MPVAHRLRPLFRPTSVAVIGASRDESKLGNIIVRNIVDSGYSGKVYPVNPKADAVRGLPCYPSYSEIPEVPDLAIIAIPSSAVFESLQQLHAKGTRHVVILSAGFREAGSEGEILEEKIRQFAKKEQLEILGPNCLGFVTPDFPINASFGQGFTKLGKLRFISQSGAIATSIFDWSAYTGVGFSDFVTLGNKVCITECDVLEYWLHSKNIGQATVDGYSPIGMYLESISDGRRLLDLFSHVTAQQPVFVIKPGKSAAAKKAMQSHTGSLAGDDAVLGAAFQQCGVIRCEGLEDVFDLSRLFSWTKQLHGPRVAVISNAGGPAVMSSDMIEGAGLELAVLNEDTIKKLEKHLPRAASLINPIDVLGDALAARYENAINTLLEEDNADALVILLTPQVMTQIEQTAEVIARLAQSHKKPIICSFMGGSQIDKGEAILNAAKIPSFRYPERAIRALGAMWRWENWRTARRLKNPVEPSVNDSVLQQLNKIVGDAAALKRETLDNLDADRILNLMGLQTPHTTVVRSVSEAEKFAHLVGAPLVLKLSAPGLLHKAAVNGVKTHIMTRDSLHENFDTLHSLAEKIKTANNSQCEIQIQQQVPAGLELFLGCKYDPTFGRITVLGSGGGNAEILNDAQIIIGSVSDDQIVAALMASKIGTQIIKKMSNAQEIIKKLTIIVKSVTSVFSHSNLETFEINPLIIEGGSIWAVDAKAIVSLSNAASDSGNSI